MNYFKIKLRESFIILYTLFIISCQKQADFVICLFQDNPYETEFKPLGIASDITELKEQDAAIVAELFLRSLPATKSFCSRQIKNIYTIHDNEGHTAIYAINYQNGYVLVSATKNYYPILAEVKDGNFPDTSSTDINILLNDYLTDISNRKANPILNVDRKLWKPYELKKIESSSKTKVIGDDWDEKRYELMEKLRIEGYNVYTLKNKPEQMPDALYNSYVSEADLLNPWGDQLDYLEASVIAEKEVCEFTSIGPLLKTHWDQVTPYNSSLSDTKQPLGCVTIAVGQIMKYFEYPNNYLWEAMPNDTSSTVLCDFLAQLRKDLWTTSSGGSNYINAMRVFRNNGYDCESFNHSSTTTVTSLKNRYPVYMRGETATNSGHAWVCDGVRFMDQHDEYALYILNDQLYPQMEYIQIEKNILNHTSSRPYFSMNWGWGGSHDGWYLDINIDTPNGNFSSSRKDVIIKPHK